MLTMDNFSKAKIETQLILMVVQMKQSILIVYLAFIAVNNLFAQEESHTFYYPLNIGDVWQYGYFLFGDLFAIETRTVTGDTLMPNGKTYRIIETDFPISATQYQRIVDSTLVFQFCQRFEPPDKFIYDEFLLFKLDIKLGDTWNFSLSSSDSGFFKVTQVGDTTLWSQPFRFAEIEDFTLPDSTRPIAPNDYYLADNIGVFFHGFEGGFLRLRGAIINNKQYGTITTVRSYENEVVKTLQNYPNPFNSFTTIEYSLNNSAMVRISIFNVLGQRVKILQEDFQTPGLYRVQWNGTDELGFIAASGIYFYLLEVNGVNKGKRKMSFLK